MVNLQGTMIVLHGPPKVGKTQFVDSMPGPVQFLATEHGHKFIREENKKKVLYFQSGFQGWTKFKLMLDQGVLAKRKPKTVAIDTATKLYERCFEWVCNKKGWEHASDPPMGKGWNAVRLEFAREIEKLAEQCVEINATLVFLDHTEIVEIDAVVRKYHKTQVAMPTQPRSVVLPAADHIFYLGYETHEDVSLDSTRDVGDARWLWLAGSQHVEAGTQDKDITIKVIKNLPKEDPYTYVIKKLNRVRKEKTDEA